MGGTPRNEEVIKRILTAVTIPLQLGGGIRTLMTIERYLSLGVKRVVLGTVAHREPSLLEEACKGSRDVLQWGLMRGTAL